MSLLRQAAQAPCLPAMDAARQATSRPESGDYSSYWFGPALAAAVAAGAFGDSPDSHASAVIHCMNVNGVSAGLVSARELPDIRGQQPDRLPPGEVGGPQVQVEDVGAIRHRHRRGSGPPPADHQPAATNPDEPGGFTWPHKDKTESRVIRDIYDLVGYPQNYFESPETGYAYVRWVRAVAYMLHVYQLPGLPGAVDGAALTTNEGYLPANDSLGHAFI